MCNFVLCIYICICIEFCRIGTKNANSLNIQNNYIVNAIVPWHVETVDKCFIFFHFFTVSTYIFFSSSGVNMEWDFWGKLWEKRDWRGGCRRVPGSESSGATPATTGPTSPTGSPSSRCSPSSYHCCSTDSDPLGWISTRGPTWWVSS